MWYVADHPLHPLIDGVYGDNTLINIYHQDSIRHTCDKNCWRDNDTKYEGRKV